MKYILVLLALGSCVSFQKMMLIMKGNPHQDIVSSSKRGKALYEKNCLQCHGTEGKGNGLQMPKIELVPNFIELNKKKTAKSHAANIYYGKGEFMKAYGKTFSEDEIWDLANYIATNFAE